MPDLLVTQGPDKGLAIALDDQGAQIGRLVESTRLSDPSVSRRHAEVGQQGGIWQISDLQSSNGTYVNGRKIQGAALLRHGDQIKIGNTILVFQASEEANAAPRELLHDLIKGVKKDPDPSRVLFLESAESSILPTPETADAMTAWSVMYRVAELIATTPVATCYFERLADILMDAMPVDAFALATRATAAQSWRMEVQRGSLAVSSAADVTSFPIVQKTFERMEGTLCANAPAPWASARQVPDNGAPFSDRCSIICVPITAGDHALGVIYLECATSRHVYTPEQLRLAVAIGRLSGMVVENARLLEVRVHQERLAAVGEAVSYLSHHIRNILQGLQGGEDVLDLGLRKKEWTTVSAGWSLVRRNMTRIFDLTMNMLTFGKQRKPQLCATALNHVVSEVLALARSRAVEKQVKVNAELSSVPKVQIDEAGMHQALLNIINNGIEAAPPGHGVVNVRTQFDAERGEVVVIISDNGPGIAAQDCVHIFDAFYSGKGYRGTGLGLAAAKKIVEEHGGTIVVAHAGGAVFTVRLPVVPVELCVEPSASSAVLTTDQSLPAHPLG